MNSTTCDAAETFMYYEENLTLIKFLILLGLVFLVATLWLLLKDKIQIKDAHYKDILLNKYSLLVLWAIVPPTWFVIEYFFIFLPNSNEESFKYLSYGQSVASKLWAAMSALITLIIYKDKQESERKDKEDNESKTTDVAPQ